MPPRPDHTDPDVSRGVGGGARSEHHGGAKWGCHSQILRWQGQVLAHLAAAATNEGNRTASLWPESTLNALPANASERYGSLLNSAARKGVWVRTPASAPQSRLRAARGSCLQSAMTYGQSLVRRIGAGAVVGLRSNGRVGRELADLLRHHRTRVVADGVVDGFEVRSPVPQASCFQLVLPLQNQRRLFLSRNKSPRMPEWGWVVALEAISRSWALPPAN